MGIKKIQVSAMRLELHPLFFLFSSISIHIPAIVVSWQGQWNICKI